MKNIIILLTLYLFTTPLFATDELEPYPQNNNVYFSDGEIDTSYYGKLVSLEGQVLRIELGYGNKPNFQIGIPAPVRKKVWVGSLLGITENDIAINQRIRVLGYLQTVKDDDKNIKSLTTDEFHILAFCFLNINTLQAFYLPGGIAQCKGWEAGKNPSELMK